MHYASVQGNDHEGGPVRVIGEAAGAQTQVSTAPLGGSAVLMTC